MSTGAPVFQVDARIIGIFSRIPNAVINDKNNYPRSALPEAQGVSKLVFVFPIGRARRTHSALLLHCFCFAHPLLLQCRSIAHAMQAVNPSANCLPVLAQPT